jgi:type II secretory pathway component PulF
MRVLSGCEREGGRATRWNWEAPIILASSGFLLMTLVAVGQLLRVIGSFESLFQELGVAVPSSTMVMLSPVTHLTFGAVLVSLVAARHYRGMKEWATAVWVASLLTYIAVSHAGLFEPLIRLIDQLGAKASG